MKLKIILASASERRKSLLKRLAEDFSVIASNFNECNVKFMGDCGSYVMELAEGKVNSIKDKVNDNALIIGCDTVVYKDGSVLGKPKDEEEAFNMLKSLSGSVHEVYSGIAIFNTADKRIIKDYVKTEVKFSVLCDDEIKDYIKTGEPMDKAGGYGIQGYGAVFVEEIHGCYYNVVGLPLNKLNKMMRDMGVNLK